jgi:hypothetical protein
MSVPYHEILKTPYNIKQPRETKPKPRLIQKEQLLRLEQVANYDNLDSFV